MVAWWITYFRLLAIASARCFVGSNQGYEAARLRLEDHLESWSLTRSGR